MVSFRSCPSLKRGLLELKVPTTSKNKKGEDTFNIIELTPLKNGGLLEVHSSKRGALLWHIPVVP